VTAACSAPTHSPEKLAPQAASAAWQAPPLERAISIRDGRAGQTLDMQAWLDQLAEAEVVFLGETHRALETQRALRKTDYTQTKHALVR
jgi:hypothetical protein